MTYEESAQLMNDTTFRGRIKTACLNFATYVLNEATTVPAHNTRVRWAQNTYMSPENAAMQVQPPVVMDPNVQAQGAAIPDDQLQAAVEDVIQKVL
jgi:hypothetical protein